MALQLDIGVVTAKNADQTIDEAANAELGTAEHRASRERDQSRRHPVEILEGERAFAFRRAQLHRRQQPAKIAVPLLGLDEDGELENAFRSPQRGVRGTQSAID